MAGSIEVRKLTVNSNGSTTPGALVAPTGNYSVVLPTTANNNQWQIAFTNPISEPYLITFKTDVDGKVLGATEKTINNHAYLSGTGYTTKDLTASVTIPKAVNMYSKKVSKTMTPSIGRFILTAVSPLLTKQKFMMCLAKNKRLSKNHLSSILQA